MGTVFGFEAASYVSIGKASGKGRSLGVLGRCWGGVRLLILHLAAGCKNKARCLAGFIFG